MSNVTVVVPTLNRPDFVGRLLRYYAAVGFTGHVQLGDSSTPEKAQRIQAIVKEVSDKVTVRYLSCPELNDSQTIRALLERTETPYVAFVADDDFIIPYGMQRCAEFLDGHPDYSVAHGKACLFELKQSGAHGEMAGTGEYRLPGIVADTGSERLLRHIERYGTTLFSLHRTEQFRRGYRNIDRLPDKAFTELLPVCHSAIQGKGILPIAARGAT